MQEDITEMIDSINWLIRDYDFKKFSSWISFIFLITLKLIFLKIWTRILENWPGFAVNCSQLTRDIFTFELKTEAFMVCIKRSSENYFKIVHEDDLPYFPDFLYFLTLICFMAYKIVIVFLCFTVSSFHCIFGTYSVSCVP